MQIFFPSAGRRIRSIVFSKFSISSVSSTTATNISFPFLFGSNKFTQLVFGYLFLSLSNSSSNKNDGCYLIRPVGNRIFHRHKFIFMMIVNLYHVDRNRWTSSWTTRSHQIDIYIYICVPMFATSIMFAIQSFTLFVVNICFRISWYVSSSFTKSKIDWSQKCEFRQIVFSTWSRTFAKYLSSCWILRPNPNHAPSISFHLFRICDNQNHGYIIAILGWWCWRRWNLEPV